MSKIMTKNNKTKEFLLAIKKLPEIEIDWDKVSEIAKEYYGEKAKIQAQLDAICSKITDEVFLELFSKGVCHD